MKKYELFLILPGTLDEKESEVKMNEVLTVINEFGSESSVKSMGKNRLSYPINNVRYGYLYTIVFQSEPQNIKIIEDKLKLFRGLLRAVLSNYNDKIESAENNKFFNDHDRINVYKEKDSGEKIKKIKEINQYDAEMIGEDKKETEKESDSDKKDKIIIEEPEKLDLKEIDKKLDEILSDDNNINI